MKLIIIAMILLLTTGCTLHQKSTLSKIQITDKVDRLLDESYAFALKSERYAQNNGRKLTKNELVYAKSIGLKYPENVRVVYTPNFPVPENKEVLKAFKELGYDSILVAGVTYGHGIYIKNEGFAFWLMDADAILAHELVHVGQVEHAKNYKSFIRTYLIQAFSNEYFEIPYEKEAYTKTAHFKGFDI